MISKPTNVRPGTEFPRELRSHTCNSYYCQPLQEWINRPTRTEAQLTAVVILHEDRVVRSILIDEE